MIDGETLRLINAAVAVVALFAIATGLVVEWAILGPWRYVLTMVVAQQALLAYGFVDVLDELPDAPAPFRLYLWLATVTGLLVTGLVVTHAHHRTPRRTVC